MGSLQLPRLLQILFGAGQPRRCGRVRVALTPRTTNSSILLDSLHSSTRFRPFLIRRGDEIPGCQSSLNKLANLANLAKRLPVGQSADGEPSRQDSPTFSCQMGSSEGNQALFRPRAV